MRMRIWERSAQEKGKVNTEPLVIERQEKRPVWPEHVGGECGNGCGECKIMEAFAGPGKS